MGTPIDRAHLRDFITRTESMVSPKDVGKLYQRAEMLAKLPIPLQQWIVDRAGGDAEIGFVVEPYCFFLAHEIVDEAAATALLPPDYELAPSAIFEGTAPRYCGILGAFNVHTSVFWGSRVELYVIARNTRTGMLSWIICDYESNTISYDPGQGFSGATTSRSVITTSHRGEVIVDVHGAERPNRLTCVADLEGATMQPLDQPLWIEGNLSVDYGGRLMEPDSAPFGLVFDPGEMERALRVPLDAVTIEANTFGASFLDPEPFESACFPYAQHFLTTSFPEESAIRDRAGLQAAVVASIDAE
ncbi:MAG: hypothetical protein AB1Z55_04965 [Acidimicrobiia bacterium]